MKNWLILLVGIVWIHSCGPTEMASKGPSAGGASDQESGNRAWPRGSSDGRAKPRSTSQTDREAAAEATESQEDDARNAPNLPPDETQNKDGKIPPLQVPMTEEDIFKALPSGMDQLKILCSRPGQDKVRKVFCGPNPPQVRGLADLQKALGLGIVDPTRTGRGNNGTGGNAAFVFSAGSSSLVGKFTSAINPRLIMFTPPTGNPIPDLVSLGFVRGEQFVEIIAGDPSTRQLNFFLVHFEQECNGKEGGCKVGELLTPGVEKDWKKFTILEDEDIQNTIVDCKQCHQPDGEGTPKILRMQELRNPWTHFMRDNNAGGQALIADYQAAHGTTEEYAAIPPAMISSSDPAKLEDLIRDNGFGNQPNEFPTRTIEGEVRNSSPAQPRDNTVPGTSQTWQALYDRYVTGQFIAPPYHDVKVTDPQKLASMTKAYQDFRSGVLDKNLLPDIRQIFPDEALRDMGFMVKAGLAGQQLLMNACAQCHNSKLPQNISRARFNVDLSKMSREEKDLAIERLKLPETDPRRMPPARIRSLTDEEIKTLTDELKK